MQTKGWRWAFGLSALALFIFSYLNQFLYRYEVPPGGDAVTHNSVVMNILQGQWQQVYQYHSFWHLIVALLSILLHMRPITVMAWLGPFLLVSMGLTLYYFNKRFFGPVAGLAALILIGFFSFQPYQTLYDGGFPNVLAAGTVLPLLLIALEACYRSRKKIWAIGLFLLALIILFFSHHLTTLYTLPILFLFFLGVEVRRWRQRRVNPLFITVGLLATAAVLIAVVGLFLNSNLVPSVHSLASAYIAINFVFPFVHFIGKLDNPGAYLALPYFPALISNSIVYLGLAGFLVALYRVVKRPDARNWRVYLLLVTWTLVLTIGSQIPNLGFPVRLARDLAIPLALLAGLFIQVVIQAIVTERLPKILIVAFLIAIVAFDGQTLLERTRRVIEPNQLINHLHVDTVAADYITAKVPLDAHVAVFQSDDYMQLFTPLHGISYLSDPEQLHSIITYTNVEPALKSIDYLYLEENFDRPQTDTENYGIIDPYLHSPYVTLVAVFEQPEKKTFLFKVNH